MSMSTQPTCCSDCRALSTSSNGIARDIAIVNSNISKIVNKYGFLISNTLDKLADTKLTKDSGNELLKRLNHTIPTKHAALDVEIAKFKKLHDLVEQNVRVNDWLFFSIEAAEVIAHLILDPLDLATAASGIALLITNIPAILIAILAIVTPSLDRVITWVLRTASNRKDNIDNAELHLSAIRSLKGSIRMIKSLTNTLNKNCIQKSISCKKTIKICNNLNDTVDAFNAFMKKVRLVRKHKKRREHKKVLPQKDAPTDEYARYLDSKIATKK